MSVDIFKDQRPAVSRPSRPRFNLRSFVLGLAVASAACSIFVRDKRSDPRPIVDEGLRVLIVEETEKRGELTSRQRQALLSTDVRQWLDENCVKDAGQPARLLVDSDTDVSKYGSTWSKLREHATPPFPCVVVSEPPKLTRKNIGAQTGPQDLIQLIQTARGQ